jgi:hypothetical protein
VEIFYEVKPQKSYLNSVQWSEAERCLTALLHDFLEPIKLKPAFEKLLLYRPKTITSIGTFEKT